MLCRFVIGRFVPMLLQKDFAHLGEQYWFNVRRVCATTIQRNPRPDSIVTNFYFTELVWRLLQHNRHQAAENDVRSYVGFWG
jgi:hypothetical protein